MKKSRLLDMAVICFFALCVAGIYITNLRGNFFLTGWDNLHPEFDYKTNISRSLFSAWQEYQGVGLPAGNAHATELFKELVFKNFSHFMPLYDERKFFFLLMLIIGPIGIYFLLKNIFFNEKPLHEKVGFGAVGGIMYLFHIATVQIFYTPYESFASHYAFLPWMIFSLLLYLRSKSKRSLLFVLLIHLIGSMQFYIPTLFIVYCFAVFIIVVIHFFRQHSLKGLFTHGLLLVFCVLVVNSYWFLPFLNYTFSNIHSQLNSYSNLMYSEDIYLANLRTEGLKNAVLFKGFLINYVGLIDGKPDYMMKPWRNFTETPLFVLVGFFSFILILIGTVRSFWEKKITSIGILFLIFFCLMAINVPPFSFINTILRENTLFHQVFRNPFTKFGNMLLFVESLLFTFGLEWIISFASNTSKASKKHVVILCIVVIFVLQNLSLFPIWQGYFIYPSLKKQIPKEYFNLFAYFNNKGDGRIANFPQINNNGWYTYQWGYVGSGFLWYGIKQPILDRSFDVWHKDNENYYWEMSQAIYSNDAQSLQNVFEKYQVKWLIVDGNIQTPRSSQSSYLDKTLSLLDQAYFAVLKETFGKIRVYELISDSYTNKFIMLKNNLPHVISSYNWNYIDRAFKDYGYYYTDVQNNNSNDEVFYPLRSLFTSRSQNEFEFHISDMGPYYSITKTGFTVNPLSYIHIPSLTDDEQTIYSTQVAELKSSLIPSLVLNNLPLEYQAQKSSIIRVIPATNSSFEVQIPKMVGFYTQQIFPQDTLLSSPPKSCNPFNKGVKKLEINEVNGEKMVRATSIKSSNCFSFDLPYLSHRFGYLISMRNRNISGRGLLVSVQNKTSDRIDFEEYLPQNKSKNTAWILLPPKEKYGLGYYLEFDNISLFEGENTINDIGEIVVQPIPLSFLNGIKIVGNNVPTIQEQKQANFLVHNVIHYDPSIYWIQFSSQVGMSTNQTLILSQAYHNGWKAFIMPSWTTPSHLTSYLAPIIGNKITNHLLINNWENGWSVDGKEDIVLIFIPQYLEFIGFAIVILTFVIILVKKSRKQTIHHTVH